MVSLRSGDHDLENSIYSLAKEEDRFREQFSKKIKEGYVNEIANDYSNAVLEKIEKEKEGFKDALTGLRNRNSYIKELPEFISLAKRESFKVSFLSIDFDYFKKINDQYGHSAGDDALKQLAQILKKTSRESDLVYRVGGEEFIVCLPDTDLAGSKIVAEKIRLVVEGSVIVVKDNQNNKIELKETVSIGIAGVEQIEGWNSMESAEIINRINRMTDAAMYHSKENGRNQVSVYSENPENPEDSKE